MTTSLAAQLKKLAVPDAQVSLGSDFKQASFLYDEKEAAKYDKQHFYNIGVNGLQQLIAKDERFIEFESSLFSPSSQSIQRLMQSSEVNRQLDETIKRFLVLLSPYVQLREAHKAIEWLVNRYNIHLRNVDAFMMCLLPFHDQEPFIMGLRLLKMNSKNCNQWRWLESVKNANTYLPQKTLVSHCRSANGFMGFMCNFLSKHIEMNRDGAGNPSPKHLVRVISFFTQTVLGAILDGPPSEQMISVLIPTLSAGFRATNLRDYMVSSFMIFSQLLTSCTITESLLSSILNVICKNVVPDLLHNALSVIILMFQKQEISKVSKKALKYLSKNLSLTSIISELSKDVKVEPFLTPFLSALVSSALKKYSQNGSASDSGTDSEDTPRVSPLSLLMNILTSVPLDKKPVVVVARAVVTWFQDNNSSDSAMEVDDESEAADGPLQVFRLLEQRYPSVLNAVFSDMMTSDESGDVKKVVESLQLQSVAKAQRDMKSDPLTFMTVCLHHHHNSVRKQAVHQLLQNASEMTDKESVQSAVVIRLQDEDPEVVKAVLQDPRGLWELFEDKQLLYSTLVKKLEALEESRDKSSKMRREVLEAICCMPKTEMIDTMEASVLMISYLLPLYAKEMSFLENLKPDNLAFSPLLQHLQGWLKGMKKLHGKELKLDELFPSMASQLIEHITSYVSKQEPVQEMKSLYKSVSKSPRAGCALMMLSLVNLSLIGKTKKADVKAALQRVLVSSLKYFTMAKNLMSLEKTQFSEYSSVEKVVSSCLSQLRKSSQVDFDLVAFCLENLNLGKAPNSIKEKTFWQLSEDSSADSNWLWTEITLLNFHLELCSSDQSVVPDMARTIFLQFLEAIGDVRLLMQMLCLIWANKTDEHMTVALQARSLQFAQVYLKSLSNAEKAKLVDDENLPVLPCLLVLMSGKSERARHASFSILASLLDCSKNSASIFNWFASNLMKYRHEVENDVAFLSQVLQNILEDGGLEPPVAKKRKSSGSKPPPSVAGLHYLMDVLVHPDTPSLVRLGLLNAFSRLDSSESFVSLMGFLKNRLDKSPSVETPDEKASLRLSIGSILQHITPNVAQCLTVNSDCLKILQQALNCTDTVLASGESVQILTAMQLSRRLMSSLPPGSCQVIFSQLLDIMASSPITAMVRTCRSVIKHMKLHSKLIVTELTQVLGKDLAATVRQTKKQKVQATSSNQETDALESTPWKRIISLLEMIQNKKKIIDAQQLVPVAFQVLGRVLELETNASGEYIKQLLLGTLLKICSLKSDDDAMNEESVVTGEHLNMELIVQCIRSSDNPHTHHQALLLLSEAAKIAPNLLLHNMMSVFTFMGASILRQDDEYSFHVIERILENVIPAIRMACDEKSKDKKSSQKKKAPLTVGKQSEDMMTVVLRVFVDAIPHIPSHRKIMLFQKLLTVVGVDSYLWRVILLVVENLVARPKAGGASDHSEQERMSGPLPASDLEFLSDLSESFSSLEYFECVKGAVGYLMQLPEEEETDNKEGVTKMKKEITNMKDLTKDDMEIFSINDHSAKQLRHFKYGTVYALAHLMASQHLVAQLSKADPQTFLDQYQDVLERVLQFICLVTKSHDQHQQDSSARFWKIFLHKCHDLLDNMVNLLPDSMFLKVVSGLMEHSLAMVQKRSMDLLNLKLQYYKDSGVQQQQRDLLLDLVSKLQATVKKTLLPKSKAMSKEEDIVIGQTAIYSLKVLCRILGEASHEPFLEVLRLCMKALSRHEDNGTVSASAMLCLAEVVSCAKVHAIDHLQELMPLVIHQLQAPTICGHEVLLLATITSLQKIIEAVPLFLSPYLADIIIQVCLVDSEVNANSHKPVVLQKMKLISSIIAKVTATRTFLPVLKKCFATLQDKLANCAECLMGMMKDHISNMSREDMGTFCQDLLKFFLECLDIRTTKSELTLSQLAVVEGFVVEAFVALVFKLSEVQFKPMLLQLYSWATDMDASKDRVLTFYRLCSSLAEKLKNLFTLFAGHILKHSCEVLDANHKAKADGKYFGKGKKARGKSCHLIEYILSCLQKTFMHDTEGFMTKDRFDVVMQPIVDQLENSVGDPDEVDERVEKFLVPCIASLAVAAKDDSLWKDMNYQILLKTRHKKEKVRLRALTAVDAFHKQLGEDYTQLVPETIPFIAELMEDESDEVEKCTQKVIAAMEVSVGENLQEYF